MIKGLTLLLAVLHIIGFDPNKQNWFAMIRRLAVFLYAFTVNVKNFAAMIVNNKGIEGINDLYTIPGIVNATVKLAMLAIYFNDLKVLLDYPENFWPDNKFGPVIEKEMKRMRKKTDIILIAFICWGYVVSTQFSLYPVLDKKHERPPILTGLQECDYRNDECYQILFGLQASTTIIIGIPYLLALDSLFFYFVGQIYCSFQLLKLSLQAFDLNWENDEDVKRINTNIGEFVHQHNIILEYIRRIKEFFSLMLLFQAGTVLLSLVYSLYSLTFNGFPPPLVTFGQSGSLGGLVAAQFLYYCIGGSIIVEQSDSVSFAVYDVEWWRKVPRGFRNSLSLMILRAQRPENLTLGKIYDLNLATYLAVIRAAMSVYTLLLNVQNM